MTLCLCNACAGGEETLTPAPSDYSCGLDNCAICDSTHLGCVICDDGFYGFLNFGGPSTTFQCFDCQQLNCAAGGCSDGGASAHLPSCA